MKKHFAFRETHLCYLSYLNQTKYNKMTPPKEKENYNFKSNFMKRCYKSLAFLLEIHCQSFFSSPTPS